MLHAIQLETSGEQSDSFPLFVCVCVFFVVASSWVPKLYVVKRIDARVKKKLK